MIYSRRLFVFSSIMALDTLFAAAAAPLVPGFADAYALSKTEIGIFVAAHSAGSLTGGIAAVFVSTRVGCKRLLLVGVLVSAGTSVMFGLADSAWELNVSRFGHGVGSSLSWTAILVWMTVIAPRTRLGWVLGVAWGAVELGSVLGPLLGGTASRVGLTAPFVAIAIVTLPLAVWLTSLADDVREDAPARLGGILVSLASVRVAGALWLSSLPAFILGTVGVLVPVQLDLLGWDQLQIGFIYAFIGLVQITTSVAGGRLSDRRSVVAPLQIGLVGAALAAAALALPWAGHHWRLPLFVLAIFAAVGFLLAPSTVLVSRESEAVGLQQGVAFSLTNVSWAPGAIAGALVGGGIATVAGDSASFWALACVCALTFLTFEHARRRPGIPRAVPAGAREVY